MDLTTLVGMAVLGALLGAVLVRGWSNRTGAAASDAEWVELKQQLAAQSAQLQARDEQIQEWRLQREQANRDLDNLRQRVETLTRELATLTAELEAERRHAQEKIELLTQARETLSEQFRNLANDILEDKSKRFTETNAVRLGELLGPLGIKIAEFQKKVEHAYDTEGRARSELAGQVKQLMELNQVLSADAKNLTQALKGSNKAQGNWGELILERVLEGSGLRKGHEYVVQESHTREDGSRAMPDVVIRLPDERFLVVDAKVSLVAYEQAATQEDDKLREAAIKRHVESLRAHIRGLSSKNYQQIYDIRSLDFVMLFIPVEPAFMMAIAHDPELYMEAWNRQVLLVSPSTLLFVLRTVEHLWRQEAQSRNAQDIASRGAELYDKLVGFVEDLDQLGERLKQAQTSYDKARGKFSSGRGNLVRQAEMLRELGLRPTKTLPTTWAESARHDDSPDADAPATLPR
jgi:DNA recombination protein RmuC